MAKIMYVLKKNTNEKSDNFGRWFAQVKSLETLGLRKMADHIAEHGSLYTSDVVFGVLEKFRKCCIEQLLNSRKVKIDGLGTFYTTCENQKGGAESKEKFTTQQNIKALHIRFLPEQTTEMDISSRQFIKRAEFVNAETWLNGKEEQPQPEP
jgi:predicted histone-like DNA-binding protein